MKTIKKSPLFLALFLLSLFVVPMVANGEGNDTPMDYTLYSIEGAWAYDVQNVDPQYSKGYLHITNESGQYAVNVELPDSTLPTEEVTFSGNQLNFTLFVEGDRVTITLIFDGDTFSGEGSSSNGPFTLSGKRMQ